MADLSHINGKAAADISHYNGKALGDITHIDGLAVVSGNTVTIKFESSTNWLEQSTSNMDGYREVIISGMQSGDTITINFSHGANFFNYIDSAAVYYAINQTTTWTYLDSYGDSGLGSSSIPGVDYGDTVYIRLRIEATGMGASGDIFALLTGGSFTSGSGTVTDVSPNTFSVAFLEM